MPPSDPNRVQQQLNRRLLRATTLHRSRLQSQLHSIRHLHSNSAQPGPLRAHLQTPSISPESRARTHGDCIAVGSTGNNGAGSTIMGTTTGGLSWTPQTPPSGTSTLKSVSCPSTADCFAAGVDSVLISRNAGYAWAAQAIPSEVSGLNGISCPSTTDCTAVGFGIFGTPVVIGTTDGGAIWEPETIPSGTGTLTAISCVSIRICHAVTDFDAGSGLPSIIVTTDGGSVVVG